MKRKPVAKRDRGNPRQALVIDSQLLFVSSVLLLSHPEWIDTIDVECLIQKRYWYPLALLFDRRKDKKKKQRVIKANFHWL